ncbi:MAG TPA: PH domain-containing protein [Nocardioidaceae bacterium]|nr:PH domain-containing protein [Nocardioidaceae bacterium]
MPAASEPVPVPLPHTFRPLGVRIAAYVFGFLLLLVVVVIWFAFSQDVRDQFTLFQRGTVIFFGLAAAVAGHALARCRVVARQESVTVVNGYKSRSYEWNELVAVSLRPGSPWATVDLSDGTTVPAMAIQGSDGSRAVTQVRQLRALLARQSHTDRDD